MTFWNADENMRYVPPTNVRFKGLEWLCLNGFWHLNVVKQSETIPTAKNAVGRAIVHRPQLEVKNGIGDWPTNMMTRQ